MVDGGLRTAGGTAEAGAAAAGGRKEILCTLGPVSLNGPVIERLAEHGASLFRINLSHTPLDRVAATIDEIRRHTAVPVCIDTEGAQIRTGRFADGTAELSDNSFVEIPFESTEGSAAAFNLYPDDIARSLEPGDFLSIDFNSVFAQVIERSGDGVTMRVLHGGAVGSNKAVTLKRNLPMPPLTEKDRAAIDIARSMDVRHFALSFAQGAEDVSLTRELAGPGSFIISKIECLPGLQNLDEITRASDAILIDRGDLSREIPIERIPEVQKRILRRARDANTKAYVATNLLESMVASQSPTRAEVNDIYNTLFDGADGLVLAAETAIGLYPVQCAAMIAKMIHEFETRPPIGDIFHRADPVSFLTGPHGGALVNRDATRDRHPSISELPMLRVRETDLLDCEQLATGTFSPLDGFMDRTTLEAVLDECRLPDGTVWTMPILLQVGADQAKGLARGDEVALVGPSDAVHATLAVSDVFQLDLPDVARKWFGTDSLQHPGVARINSLGEYCVGGRVTLIRGHDAGFPEYQLSAAETRMTFAQKGWSRVVGFHTRNAAHRVHEHIQLEALRKTGADGLFISPVIGPKKKNDFLPGPIMKSYQLMLERGHYPKGKVVLGTFATYSRYCGPREAVFTALCRKNMGCSHFIIGRDHTGVGDFYAPDANRRLFDQLGDLGIQTVYFDAIGYDESAGDYRPLSDGVVAAISGTQVRETLRAGESLPDWFMRPEIQRMLGEAIAAGEPVFYE